MARVVSNGNSMVGGGTRGITLKAKLAAVGWKYTTALRRLSSANTWAKSSSPGYLSM